eukprot:3135398-Rhodomonas_salina.1
MLLSAYGDGAECQDGNNKFPIDHAIESSSLSAGESVRLLFEAYPAAALRSNKFGQNLLHQALISALLPLACVKNSIDADVRHDLLGQFDVLIRPRRFITLWWVTWMINSRTAWIFARAECFFSVDEDGSGRIELPELLASLNAMGVKMEEEEAKVEP